jgi:hypothetical protein
MRILHGMFAAQSGTQGCYDPLPFLANETRNVIDANGSGLIVARCKTMQLDANPSSAMTLRCHVSDLQLTDTVEEKILDFLEGRTNGEELLHALHDHVLDEPIPERMLALVRARSTG